MPSKEAKRSKPYPSESMVFYASFTMIVSGATMSGKTEWVKRLLEHKDNMMSPIQKKVLFSYNYWQPSYTEMLKIIPDITFHEGMPNDLFQSKNFDPSVPNLIVFDDLMRTVLNDVTAADLPRGVDLTNLQTEISGVGYFWTTQKSTLPLTENPKKYFPKSKPLKIPSKNTIHLAKVKHDMMIMENRDYWSIWCIKLDPKILLKMWNT